MMKHLLLICILICFGTESSAQTAELKVACIRFDQFNTAVRDNKIPKKEAMAEFQKLIIAIRSQCNQIDDTAPWVFPVQGYNYRAMGSTKTNDGYSDKGYSYFYGNKHGGHPAHDLFIHDKNQDCMDDKTQKPVNILAAADGVVIACCTGWDTTSLLRGGKYIWIFHPKQNILTYYAHNSKLFVSPGDVVKQGDKIAEMGRTGFSAYKKRSPTHVHFSSYHLVDNLPVAYNCYDELIKAKTK